MQCKSNPIYLDLLENVNFEVLICLSSCILSDTVFVEVLQVFEIRFFFLICLKNKL